MKLKGFPQMRTHPRGLPLRTSVLLEARGLYIIRGVAAAGYSRDPLRRSMRCQEKLRLMGCRNPIISVPRRNVQPFFVHDHFDAAIGRTIRDRLWSVAQGVLISQLR